MMANDEEELYQDHILEHYEEPYHRGHCAPPPTPTRTTTRSAATWCAWNCRSTTRGTIEEVFFDGDGCCISQASASMLVEKFDGKHVDEVKHFTAEDMLDLFGARLTPNRQKCCLLPWRVLQAAIYSPLNRTGSRASQLRAAGKPP